MEKHEQPDYEIVWITTPDELTANRQTVAAFFDLYESPANFPDPDEREPRENILERVATNSTRPHTHLLAYRTEGEVRGGLIAEFYPKSRCVLLTYIFVHPDFRGQGVASKFIKTDKKRGVPGLLRHIEKRFKTRVQAVLFESNNPMKTEEANDSMPPADRLARFYKLGGKRFPFEYRQPPLGDNLGEVDNLFLCSFPALTGHSFVMPRQMLVEFLAEFQESLKEFHPLFESKPGIFNEDLALAQQLSGKKEGLENVRFQVPELENMVRSLLENKYAGLSELIYLKELPLKERPQLQFRRASICFEFVVDESYFEPTGFDEKHPGNDDYCVATHSFETDLFSYSFQTEPPYFTRCYNFNTVEKVRVCFPSQFEFVSEGRQEMLFLPIQPGDLFHEVPVNVFVNFTWFRKSRIRTWHIVLASDDDQPLNELDIIKLTKFFGGAQESRSFEAKHDALRAVQFFVEEDSQYYSFFDLFERLTAVQYSLRPIAGQADDAILTTDAPGKSGQIRRRPRLRDCLKSGIVQIDTDFCEHINMKTEAEKADFQQILADLFQKLGAAEEGKKVTAEGIQTSYERQPEAEYVFEAFCGITLGILDYSRMGYEEISDTLLPRSATENSFLTINRGVLTSFGYGDTVLDSARMTIGINPYLMVPSAVLAHNEYVAIDAEHKMEKMHRLIEDRRDGKPGPDFSIRQLEEKSREIQSLLDIDFTSNVFQYPTEQDLYEYGMNHRGINERIRRVRAYLTELNRFIESENERTDQEQAEKLTKYQTRVSDAAYLIAGVQLITVLMDIFESSFQMEKNYTSVMLSVGVAIGLLFLVHQGIKWRWKNIRLKH